MPFWSQFCNCLFCLLFCRAYGQVSSGGSGDEQCLAPYLITCSLEVSLADSGSGSNNFSLEEQCYIDFQKVPCDNDSSIVAVHGCACPQNCARIKVCVWRCLQHQLAHDNNSPANTAAVCRAPSNETVAQATLTLLEFFGWRRALALTDSTTPQEMYNEVVNSSGHSLVIGRGGSSSSSSERITETLGVTGHRIVVLLHVETSTAVKSLCDAHRLRRCYPDYAWIIVGVDVDSLLQNTTDSDMLSENCTLDNVKTVLNYSLTVEPAVSSNTKVGWHNCVLHNALSVLGDPNETDSRTCMSSWVNDVSAVISGTGVSCDGDASQNKTVAVVFQYRLSKRSELKKFVVGTIEETCESSFTVSYTKCENEATIWPDGIPPDGASLRVLDATHIATFITSIVLYGILVLFALGCILFNILFRKRRVVKLTSLTLNYVMIFGAVLLGTAVVMYNTPVYSTDMLPPLCISRIGALIFGHDICFGIALMKLVRIHYIFRNPNPKKKTIKDWHLLSALGVILGVEAVGFILLQTIAFTVTTEFGKKANKENPVTINAMGIREEHYIIICGNPPPDYVIAAFSVTIKITMHVIAIVLALRTRNIEVDAVNDAKETQATVYASTVLILIFLVCNFTLEGYPNVYGIAVGLCTFLECIIFLGLMFIPKVVIFCKDPMGKNVFKTDLAQVTSLSLAQYSRQTSTLTLSSVANSNTQSVQGTSQAKQ